MIINPYIFGGFDPDAQAFITAASITNTTQQNAINTLVVSLKGYGVWSKMKAIYPFVGGTASTHKWNLKDPRDLDAAFRLVFNGGWTHSANGALPNGTNAFANSYLNPSLQLSLNNSHLSYYSRTNISGNQSEIGLFNQVTNIGIYLLYNFSGTLFTSINSNTFNRGSTPFTPTTGLLIGSRINSTQEKYYFKNNTPITYSQNTTSLINGNVYLACYNRPGNMPTNYSSKEVAFSSIGDGLTDTEASNLYLAVQNYQVALSRQV
jgi:hypothetical protein